MSREFSKREKALLLVLCVLLLGILYWQFIYKATEEAVAKYDTVDLETDLLMEQTKASQIKQMEAELKNIDFSAMSVVESYNNMKSELAELNDIFAASTAYNLDFATPVRDGDDVRRNINITFTAPSYARAEAIIESIYNCKYRCLIRDVSIANGSGSNIGAGSVRASMTVTFFETMYNATTEKGLEEAE